MDAVTPTLKPILLIAHGYPPENLIGALRPGRMARYLPDYGYVAHVITASEQPPGVPSTVHYAPPRRTLLESVAARILPVADESLSWVETCAQAGSELLSQLPIKAVVSTFPPLSVHLAALKLKRRYGLKWIADFRDPLRGSFGRRELLAQPLNSYYENRFFRHADALIANTDAAARFWISRFPQYKAKISVIYNGFDSAVEGLKPAPLPARAHRVLLHSGSIYRSSFVTPLLACVNDLVTAGKINPGEIKIEFLGEMDGEAALRETLPFQALAARNMIICRNERVPGEQARKAASEADFLLVLDRDSPAGILQLPAKVFEYIQIGRPILAVTEPGSPVEHVLSLSGIPHVCLYVGDPREVQAAKLLDFLQLPNTPVSPAETYLKTFESSYLAGQLAAILDKLDC